MSPVKEKESKKERDTESLNPVLSICSLDYSLYLQNYPSLQVVINVLPTYIRKKTSMDFHIFSLRILYNWERRWPRKGDCHNLPSLSDLKLLETPPRRKGRGGEMRRTRTIMLLFYTVLYCLTRVKKHPSATAIASLRMWRDAVFPFRIQESFFVISLERATSLKSRNERWAFFLPPLLSPQKFAVSVTTHHRRYLALIVLRFLLLPPCSS